MSDNPAPKPATDPYWDPFVPHQDETGLVRDKEPIDPAYDSEGAS